MNIRRNRFGKFAGSFACFIAAGSYLGFSPIAKADVVAYMAINTGEFGTIDLNTGVFSSLGSTEAGSSLEPLSGMAEVGGTLYGAAEGTNANGALYTINPANGALTTVGATGLSIDDFGSSSAGLFAVDSFGTLYSINATTGAATAIGSHTIALAGYRALSTNAGSLYFADGNSLYTLDTTTGAEDYIGAFGMSSSITIQLGALLGEDGSLYGGAWAPYQSVATVDATSGAATIGPALTGAGSGEFVGLAAYPISSPPPPSVPEPGTSVLLGTGIAALLLVAFRRRNRPSDA